VYIGKGLPPEGLLGQEEQIFVSGCGFLFCADLRISDDLSGDIELHVFVKSGLRNIHEFDAALDLLLRCSVRRSKHRPADSLA